MRTSLTETGLIDGYLMGRDNAEDRVVFEARTLTEPDLAARVADQRRTYPFIREYGRARLREEIAAVDRKLFSEPAHTGFRRKILSYFKKH